MLAGPGAARARPRAAPSAIRATASPGLMVRRAAPPCVRRPRRPEEHIVRAGARRHHVERRTQILPAALVGRDEPEQQVRTSRRDISCRPRSRYRRPLACAAKNSGVAQVLSISTTSSRACAASAIAGMSCISKESEPGASVNTARVFGWNKARDAGADQRIVVGRLHAEAASGTCRRRSASAGRPSPAPADGPRP